MPGSSDESHDPLRVALDATPLLGVMTGVGAFCAGALGALARQPEIDVSAFAVSWRRRHELGPQLPAGVRSSQRPMPARPLHMSWSHLPGPPAEWFVGPVDVVHGTNYVVPPTRRAGRVVTVHDLTAVRFPQLCDSSSLAFPRLVRRAADHGAWIHTPSRFVAEEVVAELGVDPERVRPVHHGIPPLSDGSAAKRSHATPTDRHDPSARERSSKVEEVALPGGTTRYVLAIGTVEPRKDYPLLVRAFDRVVEGSDSGLEDLALVIAGADGWGTDGLVAALDAARHRDRVVRAGYVEASRLACLLRSAAVLAYPSVYEGFGFVPLEAMEAGVPVVATAAGAVPEVAGDGALLVPPGDTDALAGALETVLTDDAARSDLVERGRRRAAEFTWSACAAGLSGIYTDAAR